MSGNNFPLYPSRPETLATQWLLRFGVVTGHDPKRHAVQVVFRDTLEPTGYALRVLMPWADGYYINCPPLPREGTLVLCAFPMGDDRNGIVLGALEGSEISAIPCTDNPSDAYLDFIRYPNNVYRYADSSGNITWYHPSGMVINISTEAPPSPPSPMLQPLYNIPSPSNPNLTEEQTAPLPPQTAAPYVSLGHPSGTNVLVDNQGNITINGQNDVSVTVKGTVTLNVQGNVSVQSSGSVQVSGSGNVSVQSSGGTVSVSGASSASVSASRINLLSSPSGSASIPVALMESAGPTPSTLVFAEN
jgi:hypothetical protein